MHRLFVFAFNDYINVHLDNSVTIISASHLCVQVRSQTQDLLDL